MSRWRVLSALALLCACVGHVGTYPSGAPVSTCQDMVPRHLQFVPQRTPSPYYLQPSVPSVRTGEKVRVMLATQEDAPFVGFMVQARPASGGDPLGGFSKVPDDTAKVITCGPNARSTATHRSRNPNKNVEMEWEAPAGFEGPVVFNATFVQDGATFWVGVESAPVTVVKRSLDPFGGISTTKTPIRLTTVPNYTLKPDSKENRNVEPIYKGCDTYKTCFGVPSGCTETRSCEAIATTYVRGDKYEFELFVQNTTFEQPKYVALGLSEDDRMGGDSVMECVLEGPGRIGVYMSANTEGSKNERLNNLSDKVNMLSSKYEDGNIYCRFTRETVTNVKGVTYDLSKGEYYLLLASGSHVSSNPPGLDWHNILYKASSRAVNLSEVGNISGKSDLLHRLHGCFMVSAWIGFASVGILLARYFKTTWVGKRLCGKDQWFIWHRTFMVATWSLTVSAFIMIFIEVQGWYTDTANPHAILGCVTTGLAFIQPFAATLRPAPDSPKRPIFNWLHWLVGKCAHILAVVTMFFAVKLNKAQLPEWTDWILVAFVAFHVFMHLLFSMIGCFSDGQMEKRVNDFPMKDMSSGRSPLHMMDRKRDSPHAYLRKFLLAVYLTVTIILTVMLIVIIVFAPIESHWTFMEAKKFFTGH